MHLQCNIFLAAHTCCPCETHVQRMHAHHAGLAETRQVSALHHCRLHCTRPAWHKHASAAHRARRVHHINKVVDRAHDVPVSAQSQGPKVTGSASLAELQGCNAMNMAARAQGPHMMKDGRVWQCSNNDRLSELALVKSSSKFG